MSGRSMKIEKVGDRELARLAAKEAIDNAKWFVVITEDATRTRHEVLGGSYAKLIQLIAAGLYAISEDVLNDKNYPDEN